MNKSYPVVLFVYKRHERLNEFLDLIINSGINKIYIFADGPKDLTEQSDVALVKKRIETYHIQHKDIIMIKRYLKKNVGLKSNIISGLNVVFDLEEGAIILEDDCLPSKDFIEYAQQMLSKYKSNNNIMSITGTSINGIIKYSYDYSKYPQSWGWATWARAWKLYDPNISGFNYISWKKLSHNLKFNFLQSWYWQTLLLLVKAGQINTWDVQWSYAHFYHNGLVIYPSVNLISNIGFDRAATNTTVQSKITNMKLNSTKLPLVGPATVNENIKLSKVIESYFYINPIAIGGLVRQYVYYIWSKYANRT